MNDENLPASVSTPVVNPLPPKPKSQFGLKIILFFLPVVLVGVGSFAVYNFSLTNQKNVVPVQPASVAEVPGNFSIKARAVYVSGSVWRSIDGRRIEVLEGDTLGESDELLTDKDARLVLSFDEGSVVRLGGSTKVILGELKPSLMVINEERGIIFARVTKDANHCFVAKAGSVEVESLGTTFSVENENTVKVLVFDHAVNIKQKDLEDTQVAKDQKWQEGKATPEELDKKEVAANQFLSWSLTQEAQVTLVPTVTVVPTAVPTTAPSASIVPTINSQAIYLTGSPYDNGVNLSWQVNGQFDVSKGFKLIKNTTGNPVYPGDPFVYLDDKAVRSYAWQLTDGQTWHFRVCQYLGDGCGVYSNDITVKAPSKGPAETSSGSVKSISISVSKISEGQVKIKWDVDGYSSLGFKIAWSENSNPTYPTREGDEFHYLDNPNVREDTVSGLSAGKTYHFRVCEYLGGKCGVYSSDASINP